MTSEFCFTKISMDYKTQNSKKWGVYPLRGSFDLENGPVCSLGQSNPLLRSWRMSTKNFGKNDVENSDHYSIRKLVNLPIGTDLLHSKGLDGRPQKISAKLMAEIWITIAHENW
ncbi:hypothetical protein H5410_056555 [Solanum commersonii]|uniref:Uncharacterized protein n=1 Tax=Solanum commersonii TaxID=4109 RepID=A0A9J5WM25_SOLCO|nr:hypothetical protein H5410_056555 [Solanum commersonii]